MTHATTSIILKGKMGKTIDVTYNEDNPDIVEFVIKNNRGSIKDTIEVPIENVLQFAKVITVTYKLHKGEKN